MTTTRRLIGLGVLLSGLWTATSAHASEPLPEGVWYMPGGSIGFSSPSSWLFGGELSVVCADCVRGAFPFGTWVGGYADVVHDVDREQIVDAEAVLAAQVPVAAVQRQARDARRRDDTTRDRQAEDLGLAVDILVQLAKCSKDVPAGTSPN